MNVLVTGGAGFIGSALVRRLMAAGHLVTVIDDGSSGAPERIDGLAARLNADIASDDLRACFCAARPEAVVHLAARASVAESVRDPCASAAVNVCGTVNALRHSLDRGVSRFVFASTGGALYGDSAPLPTPEDGPLSPRSPYGASKLAAEAYVRAMSRAGGMRHAILRLGNVYGPGGRAPGEPEPGVVGAFARAMLSGEAPIIYGDGLNQRDFVHLGDAVEAFVLSLGMNGDGVFNIGTGAARTVREVFEIVARAAGYAGKPVYRAARPGDLRRSCLDARRARRVLGWRARMPFERGVEQTVQRMRLQVAPRAPESTVGVRPGAAP